MESLKDRMDFAEKLDWITALNDDIYSSSFLRIIYNKRIEFAKERREREVSKTIYKEYDIWIYLILYLESLLLSTYIGASQYPSFISHSIVQFHSIIVYLAVCLI